MANHARKTPLLHKVAVALGLLAIVTGPILYFKVSGSSVQENSLKPEQTVTYSGEPLSPHDLLPKKVAPSKPKTTTPASAHRTKHSAPSVHVPVVGKSTQAKPTLVASPKPTHTWSPKPSVAPSPKITFATKTPVPQNTPSVPPPVVPAQPPATTVTWYTSPVAVLAAQRMAASGTVGDPVCSVSAYGQLDPAQVPSGVKSVGTGESNGYWCLVFTR